MHRHLLFSPPTAGLERIDHHFLFSPPSAGRDLLELELGLDQWFRLGHPAKYPVASYPAKYPVASYPAKFPVTSYPAKFFGKVSGGVGSSGLLAFGAGFSGG